MNQIVRPFDHVGADDGAKSSALYRFPAKELEAASRARQNREPAEVAVIGGGIAGLVAAYELARAGEHVALFEASQRLGGRIETARFAGARGQVHAELGAMRVPKDHDCTRHYLEVCGLHDRPFVSEERLLLLGDAEPVNFDQLKGVELADPYRSYSLPGKPGIRTGDPFELMGAMLKPLIDAFDDPGWRAAYGVDPLSASGMALEAAQLSVWQVMGNAGSVHDPITGVSTRAAGDSEMWEYVARATGQLWFEKSSLLQWLVDGPRAISAEKIEPVEGMDALITGLDGKAKELGVKIHKGREVLRIGFGAGDAVTLAATNGPDQTFRFVICAVPAPAVLAIDFDGRMPPSLRYALSNISYMPMAKAVAHCLQRPWERGFAGGASYTDLPIQQVWYPSDNVKTGKGEGQLSNTMAKDDAGGYSGEGPFETTDPAMVVSDGALTAAYCWGANAQRFIALSPDDREKTVRRCLERLHPGIEPLIKAVEVNTFGAAGLGGGAIAYFAPGEQERYQAALGTALPTDGPPRLFFAGEHLLPMHGWIQTSIQTSLAAVMSVLRS